MFTLDHGEAVEEWATKKDLTPLHDLKDGSSFMSARWKKGYNPDLVFVSSSQFTCFEKIITEPYPKISTHADDSQHKTNSKSHGI